MSWMFSKVNLCNPERGEEEEEEEEDGNKEASTVFIVIAIVCCEGFQLAFLKIS